MKSSPRTWFTGMLTIFLAAPPLPAEYFTDSFDAPPLHARWRNDYVPLLNGVSSDPITVQNGIAGSWQTAVEYYNHLQTPIDARRSFYVQADIRTHIFSWWGPTLAVYFNPTTFVALKVTDHATIQVADGIAYTPYDLPTLPPVLYAGWKFARMKITFFAGKIRFEADVEPFDTDPTVLLEIPRRDTLRQLGAVLIVGKGRQDMDLFTAPDFNNNTSNPTGTGDVCLIDNVYYQPLALGTLTGTLALDDFLGDYRDVILRVELRPRGGGEAFVERVPLDAAGTFFVPEIEPGVYDIALKAGCWLQRVLSERLISIDGLDLGTVRLANGDLDGDNEVTTSDLATVLLNMDQIGE